MSHLTASAKKRPWMNCMYCAIILYQSCPLNFTCARYSLCSLVFFLWRFIYLFFCCFCSFCFYFPRWEWISWRRGYFWRQVYVFPFICKTAYPIVMKLCIHIILHKLLGVVDSGDIQYGGVCLPVYLSICMSQVYVCVHLKKTHWEYQTMGIYGGVCLSVH